MWRGNMWVCLSVLHFWTFASRLVPLKAVYCTRPYHLEYYSSSRPISEGWDLFVLGWVTAWEYRLLWHFAQFCLFWHPCQVGDSTLLYPVSLLSGCWDDLYRNPNINTQRSSSWATNYVGDKNVQLTAGRRRGWGSRGQRGKKAYLTNLMNTYKMGPA